MEQNVDSKEREIDLLDLLGYLWQKVWFIAGAAMLMALVMYIYSSFFVTPMYKSSTRIVVLNNNTDEEAPSYQDLQISTILTNDYPEIVTSRSVIETVIDNLDLDMSYKALAGSISVTQAENSRILNISCSNADPEMAKTIVDEVRIVAAQRIKDVFNLESVNTVDEGDLPEAPYAPSVSKNTVLGFLAGFAIAAIVFVVMYLLNDTIKTSEDVEKYLGLSTLGLIPITDQDKPVNKKGKAQAKRPVSNQQGQQRKPVQNVRKGGEQ